MAYPADPVELRGRARTSRPRSFWEAYLAERTGTYAFRCRRYRAVHRALARHGLADGDIVYDVGAGMCEFGRFLFTQVGWSGRYVAVDGAIDGTDLDEWTPRDDAHAFVAIEVLEHLRDPLCMLALLERRTTKVSVITTPNPETVDVLALDSTHVSPIAADDLRARNWSVRALRLFNSHEDTLLATWVP